MYLIVQKGAISAKMENKALVSGRRESVVFCVVWAETASL